MLRAQVMCLGFVDIWQQVRSVLSSRYQNDKDEAYITHTPDKDEAYITFWKEAWT